jgi:AcrR family transcriptional regulator
LPPSKKEIGLRRRPVQERARFTRDAILQAAAEVFGRGDYRATTREVAERAGVSVGTLYQYFPNKDALLLVLFGRHLDEAEAALELWGSVAESAPLQGAVHAFVEGSLALHSGSPGLHRVLLVYGPETEALRERIQSLEERLTDWISVLLERSEEVNVPNSRMAAHLVIRVVEDLCHHRLVHPDDQVDDETFIAEVVALVAGYLRGGGRSQ